MAAKTPVYEADSVAELIGKLKSGEIPGSYVVQGLGGVGAGGKIRAVAATKGSLGAKGKATFDQEQRRQKQNKAEGKALSATAHTDAVAKLLKQVEDNKAQTALKKASDTTSEQASKQQQKQWEAYVTGLDVARAKGTLPKGFEQPTPSEVGTTNLKENAEPAAQPEPVKVSGTGTGEVKYPPIVSDDVRARAKAEYQRTGQNPVLTTDKVAQLQSQIDEQKRKIAAAQTATGHGGGRFNPLEFGDWIDKGASISKAIVRGAAEDLDYLDRYTAQPINTFVKDMGNPDKSMSEVWRDIVGATEGKVKSSAMDIINENRSPLITEDPEKPHHFRKFDPTTNTYTDASDIPWYYRVPLQAYWDVTTNPTTYVGVGTVAAGAKGIMEGAGARAAIDLNNSTIKTVAKYAAGKGISKQAENAAKNVTKKITKAGGPIGGTVTAQEQLANDLLVKALNSGSSFPDAVAGVRVAIEHEVAADAAKAKMATVAANAAKNNERILNLKVAGKEYPIGKVPLLNLPYKGAGALKGKVADTEIGKGLAKMFSSNYWFPGETKTLWNKVNSMGVANYIETHKAIREAFKGLSKADRRRVADATEQGVSLAAEFGTKGKDLGPAQKFFQEMTAKHFDEAEKVMGKYTAADKVNDYVYHHYRSGSPSKIKEVKGVRKVRMEDKVPNAERLTLQEAEDLKLRPIREADKILLAHTADHQRQMIRSAWDRRYIESYGHVLDNPIMAQKLGLVEVKAPKLMNMKPGYKLYMAKDAKKVHDGVSAFMGANDEETKAIWRIFDKSMRGWKMANTTVRPGHHIRNIMGDIFLNHLDGVDNPWRYKQGLQMATGDRGKLRIRVGNQILTGDDIEKLWIKSGANQGFISSEFLEGRNPLLRGINEFSQRREMTGRYAHFIDVLVKEGKKSNLGANNAAGLMKIATEGGRRVNKWNINYADLTPFEKQTMKRVMPFYTWTRKAMPLMVESLATRPGRMMTPMRLNSWMENLLGVDPSDTEELPIQQWLKDQGYARLNDASEPNVWSIPLPSQDLSKWLSGGTYSSLMKNVVSNTNPLIQHVIEAATDRNLFTGGPKDPNELTYAAGKFGIVKNILDAAGVGDKPVMNRLNAALGLGTSQVTEQNQLSELRRQQDPLDVQLANINKDLGDFEVHKLKYGYSVYNKHWKITEKDGFATPEDALIHAIGLNEKAKKGKK